MALTEFAVRAAKPAAKDTKLFDERGLYLLVCANGSKLWRLKYRFSGREKLLSLGAYPDVGLKGARDAREEARRLLGTGVDPSSQRKLKKLAQIHALSARANPPSPILRTTPSDSVTALTRTADPRCQLTAKELTHAASVLRAEARRAEREAADPHYRCSRAILEDAARVYDELAGKLSRIAEKIPH